MHGRIPCLWWWTIWQPPLLASRRPASRFRVKRPVKGAPERLAPLLCRLLGKLRQNVIAKKRRGLGGGRSRPKEENRPARAGRKCSQDTSGATDINFRCANALEKPVLGQSFIFPVKLIAVKTPRSTRIPITQPSSIKRVQRTAT